MCKMKKLIALLLAGAMVLSVAACGKTEEPAVEEPAAEEVTEEVAEEVEEVELNIAVFEGGYGRAYWDAVADAFEAANPGVTVNVEASPEISEIIRPNILAGNAPDFVYLPSGHAAGVAKAMIKDHALADISDVMAEVSDVILPGFLETTQCQPYGDGKIYLAPMYCSAMGLWYNKTFFEENSLEVPVTWDDFFALGDKDLGRSLFTYQGIYPSYLESMVYPAIASAAGVDVVKGCLSYDAAAWQNENVKKVLDNVAKIGTEGYLMEGTTALDHTTAQGQWLLGEAMFHPNGTWVEGEMADAPREEGFEFGFTAPPVLDANGDKYVYASMEEMWIPAGAKNIEVAKEFLKFQYSEEAMKLNAELALGVPPVVGASEIIKPYVSGAVYEAYTIFEKGYKPFIGGFAALEGTEIVPANEFWNPTVDIMSGKMTVDQWIQTMVDVSTEVHDFIVK